MTYRIAFSAGEFSGDEHLSEVLKEIRSLIPDAEFRGLAGPKTRALGIKTELALEDYASIMGFLDVAKAAPRIFSALNWFKKTFTTWQPDLLIIADYPDFNFRVARLAKAAGARVLYYIPPKLWAWRQSRVKLVKELVDSTALIFPFEKPFYEKLGYQHAVYVGHPFYARLTRESNQQAEALLRSEFLGSIGLDDKKPVLAFFPGSRRSEIKRHWPGMIAGLKELTKRIPDTQILLSVAPPVKKLIAEFQRKSPIKCTSLEGRNLEILRFSDLGFVKSGTSNLQAAFYELPFVMYYQAGLISELIVRVFVKIREFSLVNIIRPGTVRELLQKQADPQIMADELESLILDSAKRSLIKQNLREVHEKLGGFDSLPIFENSKSPAERVARLGVDLLKRNSKDGRACKHAPPDSDLRPESN